MSVNGRWSNQFALHVDDVLRHKRTRQISVFTPNGLEYLAVAPNHMAQHIERWMQVANHLRGYFQHGIREHFQNWIARRPRDELMKLKIKQNRRVSGFNSTIHAFDDFLDLSQVFGCSALGCQPSGFRFEYQTSLGNVVHGNFAQREQRLKRTADQTVIQVSDEGAAGHAFLGVD